MLCRTARLLAIAALVLLPLASAVPSVSASTFTASTFTASTFTVTTTADGGAGSLRQAISDANGSAGIDSIVFNIPGSDPNCAATSRVCTIAPGTDLPTITDPVVIDATTQPGFAGSPLIQLSGPGPRLYPTGGEPTGLRLAAGSSRVTGLIVNGWINGIQLRTLGNNVIQGNYIGTNAAGTAAVANQYGLVIYSSGNVVGGLTTGARNVISGNTTAGIYVNIYDGGSDTQVQGNYIGTDATGTVALGNPSGIYIYGGRAVIGGTAAGAGNVISGNGSPTTGIGIYLGVGASGSQVQGNYIGTQADGISPLGNYWGIRVDGTNVLIGGTAAGAANTIAFNRAAGVGVIGVLANKIAIRGNAIYANAGLGIQLGNGGLTPNDSCDGDTGPNSFQNFPVITSISSDGSGTTIRGTLNSTPSTVFTLDFYSNAAPDPSGYGEGETYLGSTTATTAPDCTTSFSTTISPAVPSGRYISATATDPSGNTSGFSPNLIVPPAIINRAPTADAGPDQMVDEGTTVTLDGHRSSDPDGDRLTYTWSVGPCSVPAVVLSDPQAATPTVQANDNGSCTFTLTVDDGRGGTASDEVTITVRNVAPTAQVLTPAQAPNEGERFTLALTQPADASSVDTAAGFTYAFDCGDGVYTAPSATRSASCPAIDNPGVTGRAKIFDKDGGATEYSIPVTILNVAPAGAITAPAAGAIFPVGAPVTFLGTVADPGVQDTHTAIWTLASVTVAGAVTEQGGQGSVSASYTFSQAGVYTVTLQVTDKDSGIGEATTIDGLPAYVVVYDPSAGYVTGHGWIDSPAGAYRADPSLAGKATFGFVSKYEQGASTPTGHTKFEFRAGGFSFHSDAYQWLVVSGAKAQYKGTGTINGVAGYSFLLTATDGQVTGRGGVDQFRIKIWHTITGAIVYDNNYGGSDDIASANPQVIGGGNIVIHK
jgi:hypothetical protein